MNSQRPEGGDSDRIPVTSLSRNSDPERPSARESRTSDSDNPSPLFELAGTVGVFVMGAAVVAAWFLPEGKRIAVFGRLDYAQFMVAILLTLVFLSIVVVIISPKRRIKAVSFRIGAVWLAVLPTLVLCEIVSGLVAVDDQKQNPWYLSSGDGTTSSKRLPYERPRHLHWEGLSYGDTMLPEETDPERRRLTFQTDHQGFRNGTDLTRADVIFIGDSYTEAGNVAEKESFVQRTARKLNVVTRNLGRAGYSTPEELIVLEEYGLPCQPAVVVWQVAEVNDLPEAVYPMMIPEERTPTTFTGNWHAHSPSFFLFKSIRTVDWPLRGVFHSPDGETRTVRFEHLPSVHQRPVRHPGWPIMVKSLKAGAHMLKQRNIELLVMMIPMKMRVLRPHVEFSEEAKFVLTKNPKIPRNESLAELLRLECQRLDITFLDVTAVLEQAAASGVLGYLQFDTHLSAAGHEVVSDAITSVLQMRFKRGP